MSLILDALRKSEAERRRGEAPGLHAPLPPAPDAARQAWRQWPILAGGALVLVAVAILLWPRAPEAPAPSVSDVPADADVAAPMPAPRPADRPAAGAPSPGAPRDAATPAAVAPAPTPAPAVAPAAVAVSPAIASPPSPSPPIEAAVAPEPPAPSQQPAPAPADEALPTLAVLAPGERAALPALKLSMHVWNQEPARRFAIVDGQRLTEGASIGGAVVSEIRRDGVVLDVNGRRLLLPRP